MEGCYGGLLWSMTYRNLGVGTRKNFFEDQLPSWDPQQRGRKWERVSAVPAKASR